VEAPVVEAPAGVAGALVAALDGVEELVAELVAAAFAAVLVVVEDEPPHALRPTQASRTSGTAVTPASVEGSLLRWDIELLCSRPT
jgi:hypothetical protein